MKKKCTQLWVEAYCALKGWRVYLCVHRCHLFGRWQTGGLGDWYREQLGKSGRIPQKYSACLSSQDSFFFFFKRKKSFLIYSLCPWSLLTEIPPTPPVFVNKRRQIAGEKWRVSLTPLSARAVGQRLQWQSANRGIGSHAPSKNSWCGRPLWRAHAAERLPRRCYHPLSIMEATNPGSAIHSVVFFFSPRNGDDR